MKIAIAQTNIIPAQCEKNFQQLKRMVKKAVDDKADIIVFPEMCISGYVLQDRFLDDDFAQYAHSFNEKIKNLSGEIGIIYGNLFFGEITPIEHGRDGRKPRYNASFFAYQKQWVEKENKILNGMHIKHLNPDYRMFDDSRYFLSGLEVCEYKCMKSSDFISPFLFKRNNRLYRIGLQVCEDLWSFDYRIDVSDIYCQQQVDMIINCSSSPYTLHKEDARSKAIKRHMDKQASFPPLIYCNAVGVQNNGKNVILFDGGSCIYGKNALPICRLRDDFRSDYVCFDVSKDRAFHAPKPPYKLLEALCIAIEEFDRQMFSFRPKWIIGLSGGLDSSINAALLVRALGKHRVIGYNMASAYNSSETIQNANNIAKILDIHLHSGSIEAVNTATIKTLQNFGYTEEYSSLVYENIQARLRGHLLSSFASIENGIIVNNGNKIEVALGYCTLYGDTIGAIAPLGDLSKVDLFALAKQINEVFKDAVIPKTLLPNIENGRIIWQTPPSAELRVQQVDPMKWYYHDELIQRLVEYPSGGIQSFMEAYLHRHLNETTMQWICYYGLDNPKLFIEDLEWVIHTMHTAIFKRIQMPPIVVLSRGAFGNDYRESQIAFTKSDVYQTLRKKILKMA
ncbi:MAG: NAD(+) synthase [Breznakia sp.]